MPIPVLHPLEYVHQRDDQKRDACKEMVYKGQPRDCHPRQILSRCPGHDEKQDPFTSLKPY
ncbi:hypothetical protein MBAV_003633 [Candidatus Magnetobacterium bavaricum]|uniref:Uncharacterized protein n=1 Tax=Candidatus Magnetobacterium bavaricum TaxID=29290 RepID=A0A0F3GQA9_9BACT|nr:hypothetical protein MBAV_003633 [Candidatus Magnetobacterium bavaricum]